MKAKSSNTCNLNTLDFIEMNKLKQYKIHKTSFNGKEEGKKAEESD